MADEHLAKQFLHELMIKECCLVKRRLYELCFQKNALENSRWLILAHMYRLKFHREKLKRPLCKNESQTIEKGRHLNAMHKTHGLMQFQRYNFWDFRNLDVQIRQYEINLKNIEGELYACNKTIRNVEKMLEDKKNDGEVIRQADLDIMLNKT